MTSGSGSGGGGGSSGGSHQKNPFSAMPVGSSTALPSSARRRWGGSSGGSGGSGGGTGLCGGGSASLAAFLGLLFASTLLLLRWGPGQSHAGTLRGDPNYVDPARVDPSLYSDFTPQLILREGHEDWVAFDRTAAPHYFTPAELASLPPPPEERARAVQAARAAGGDKEAVKAAGMAQCHAGEDLPQHCCLGSFSLAGIMAWAGDACLDADFFKFQVPHRSNPGLGLGRYHDMGDVLRRLGNRTLSFLGDSLASQHAHAMECSWLRSGKARTLFYEKEDYHRIFSANGTGFSRAGRYGTNALYTWRTETTTTDGLQRGGEEGEEGHDGVQATMKLYMAYRPYPNETQAMLDTSDAVVINFGLHYLLEDKRAFEEEMRVLLELARPFAAPSRGKALVWRESSAQHHLSEGGEFPVTEFPERLGVSKVQAMRDGPLCHPLRFGARVAPQWRDKIMLELADALGYRVHFLGRHEGGDRSLDEQGQEHGDGASEASRRHHAQRRRGRGGVNATEDAAAATWEGRPSAGPPPRRERQLEEGKRGGAAATAAAAAAVVGADGSLAEAAGEEGEPDEGKEEQPVLYWMPFFRITAGRHDLHPYNPWRQRYDCTHFCYTPLLWDPLVDSLHAAVAGGGFGKGAGA